MKTNKIAVIAGDGIGKEVMPEGVRALDAAARKFGLSLAFDHFDWSCDNYDKHGWWMPPDWKERIGGHEPIRVDVRVIAASNKPLQELIAQGRFREDLFYRLNVIPIEVPPLRRRKEDIPLLVEHFFKTFSAEYGKRPKTLSGDAMVYFMAYDWPGNVRELRNMVERLVIMTAGDTITPEDLPPPLRAGELVGVADGGPQSLREAREAFERAFILAELRANGWNITRTAKQLGIGRVNLWRKLKAYGVTPPRKGDDAARPEA